MSTMLPLKPFSPHPWRSKYKRGAQEFYRTQNPPLMDPLKAIRKHNRARQLAGWFIMGLGILILLSLAWFTMSGCSNEVTPAIQFAEAGKNGVSYGQLVSVPGALQGAVGYFVQSLKVENKTFIVFYHSHGVFVVEVKP